MDVVLAGCNARHLTLDLAVRALQGRATPQRADQAIDTHTQFILGGYLNQLQLAAVCHQPY